MTMRGRLELWSMTALFVLPVSAIIFAGCASTPVKQEGSSRASGGKDSSGSQTGALSASEGMAEIPLAKKRPSGREVTEDQKSEFDKAVNEYQRAKKGGVLGQAECSQIAGTFKRLADQNPKFLEARNNEATIYLECGRKDQAIGIWNSMANGAKPYAPALANLGYVAWQSNNKANAESLFNRSIQADPLIGSVYARINMAQILRERARLVSDSEKKALNDQAVRHLRTVLALDGNNLQAYAGLCYIYFDLGLPEAAKLVGSQAIKKSQEIATGKFEDEEVAEEVVKKQRRGKGRRVKEELKEGDAKIDAASAEEGGTGYTIEMKKALGIVFNTMGMISLSKKAYTEAIKNFTEAVGNDPNLYEARLNLAALSLKFRNYEIAERNLREVLKAQGKNYEAIIGLGVALRGNRKFDEAEVEYNRARTLNPQRPEAYFNLGVLYQEYKAGSDKPMLQKAQAFYRDFLTRTQSPKLKKDAEKRIRDIDDTFAALKEAEQMMKEAEEMQKKAILQQQQAEEIMKKQEAEEKRQAEEAIKQAEEAKKQAAEAAAKKKEEEAKAKSAPAPDGKEKKAGEVAKPAEENASGESPSNEKKSGKGKKKK